MPKPVLDDLDELLASPARPGPNVCHVCWALDQLDPVTADKMRQVLDRHDITSTRVRVAFRTRLDFVPGESAITRHRREGCAS
jgi:hypothetical protein